MDIFAEQGRFTLSSKGKIGYIYRPTYINNKIAMTFLFISMPYPLEKTSFLLVIRGYFGGGIRYLL
ncbi:MAG: hypothetical protein OEY01_02295 [Desulfobulbaceae bacterium]|nr:hypothetical protein [Desulfobulbaceae bacterium]